MTDDAIRLPYGAPRDRSLMLKQLRETPQGRLIGPFVAVTIASWFVDDYPVLAPLIEHTTGSRSAMHEALDKIYDDHLEDNDVVESILRLTQFVQNWHE